MSGQDRIREYAGDPFPSYPRGVPYSDDIAPGSVLDIEAARQWFQRIDHGRAANLYTFALPLDRPGMAVSGFGGEELLVFSTYGYLGLNQHPRIVGAATEATAHWGTTTGGVRLLTGTIELHCETERELAEFVGTQASALFASGYDANLAAVTSLVGRRDIAVLDERAHRSIVDGCRLAGVRIVRFPHNDVAGLDRVLTDYAGRGGRVLVAIDGVYSMDGDIAPLPGIVATVKKHGAFLLLDDSHAIGVIGDAGRGTMSATGVDPDDVDVITGSLGKAFPSGGGYVAGSRGLVAYLQHGSAPYMFSSALTPANTAAIRETIRVIQDEPQHLARMWENTARLRSILEDLRLPFGNSATPILPVLLGDTVRAYTWARRLLDDGIYTSAVPYPAVPEGQSRLRLCATAQHRPQDLDRLAAARRRAAQHDSVTV